MNLLLSIGGLLLAASVILAASNADAAGLKPDDPAAYARIRTLGRLMAETPDRPVHIVFVHGMRATGPGTADKLMRALCKYGPVSCPGGPPAALPSHYVEMGPMPSAVLMGESPWREEADWAASRPYVDRYIFPRPGHPPVIVDEVNWWPLLFPLKCRVLVAPEARLSGADKTALDLCRRGDGPYHAWLSEAEYAAAMAGPKISGGGSRLNAGLKQNLMNWGLADAVIALGPMRRYFRKAMDGAFDFAASYDGHDVAGQEFAIVSESLGSFVVMDAAANTQGDSPSAQDVVANTSDLFFFANQFRLLELGRIQFPRPLRPAAEAPGAALAAPAEEPSPVGMLRHWAVRPPSAHLGAPPPRLKQIVAFNDPSDVLTFDVPKLNNPDGSPLALVVNVYDRNEMSWFGLFANPVSAHTGHSANRAVLKKLFGP